VGTVRGVPGTSTRRPLGKYGVVPKVAGCRMVSTRRELDVRAALKYWFHN
jgi:hypothetical protein